MIVFLLSLLTMLKISFDTAYFLKCIYTCIPRLFYGASLISAKSEPKFLQYLHSELLISYLESVKALIFFFQSCFKTSKYLPSSKKQLFPNIQCGNIAHVFNIA